MPERGPIDENTWTSMLAAIKSDKLISRIRLACDVLPIDPEKYKRLIHAISSEISTSGMGGAEFDDAVSAASGTRTDQAATTRIAIQSEDPWLENGSSPKSLATSLQNALIKQCETNGMTVTNREYDALWLWIGGEVPPPKP
jgi:hypothetical protein